ncbi:hypothetical protein [Rhodococcus sp. X156]|uniref:hypothetical protein n=1 Tax=Rhodococcus sp. X156 TaxID=2499145 RepID=UPI001F49D2BD|nr:hypothetical protein [Rhodococcus sp. X156]
MADGSSNTSWESRSARGARRAPRRGAPAPEPSTGSLTAPWTIRAGGVALGVQAAVALVLAVVLAVRTVLGHFQSTTLGYGTAVMFAVLGAGVLVIGVTLVQSRRGGRGPGIVMEVLLLPVAWSLLTDSHQVALGLVLGAVVLGTLALLLCAPSQAWSAEQFGLAHEDD